MVGRGEKRIEKEEGEREGERDVNSGGGGGKEYWERITADFVFVSSISRLDSS